MIHIFFPFFLYVVIIVCFTAYSKSLRKPIKIPTWFMSIYNIFNSMINLFIVYNLNPIFNTKFGFNLPYTTSVHQMLYLHYLTKYLDFTDTIIMILRHKWNQVHFLQLFHHSTIGVVWAYILQQAPHPSASIAFGALANSFIHFVMYLHYFVTGIGYKNPFKKWMTTLQILQFSICFIHSIAYIRQYPEKKHQALLQTLYMTAMLLLFYVYVYLGRSNTNPFCKNLRLKEQ